MDEATAEPASATKREVPKRALRRAQPVLRALLERGTSLLRTVSAKLAILVSLACLTALLAAGCSSAFVPPTGTKEISDRPNIVFVLTDDLDLTSAGLMPNLRSLLAKEGATFENAFVR